MKSNEKLSDATINKEYDINKEREVYNLRIEINHIKFVFRLKKLNETMDCIYKNEFSRDSFINNLELNINKYKNLNLIIDFFDKLNDKNNILIDKIDEENINLKIKYSLLGESIEKKIALYKQRKRSL